MTRSPSCSTPLVSLAISFEVWVEVEEHVGAVAD